MNNNKAQPEFKAKELSSYENHLVKQKLLEITDKLRQQRMGQQQQHQQPQSPSPSQLNAVMEHQQQLMHPYMTFQVHPHSQPQMSLKKGQHFDQQAQFMQQSSSGPMGHQQSLAHLQQQQQQQQQRMMYQMPLSPMQQKQMQNNQQQAYKSFSTTTPVNHGQNQNSFAQRPNAHQLVYKLSSPQQQQQQRQQPNPVVQPQEQCMYQLSPPQSQTSQYQLFPNDQPNFTWSSLSTQPKPQQQQEKQKSQQSNNWPPRSSSNQIQSQQQQQQQAQHFQQANAPQMIGYVIQTPIQQHASPQQQQKHHQILANPGININGQNQFHITHQQQQQVVGVNMTPIIATQANTNPMIAAMSQQNQIVTCLPLSEAQLRTLAKLQQDAYNLSRINSNNNGRQQQQQQQRSPVQSPLGGTPKPKKQQIPRRSLVLVDVDGKKKEDENDDEMYEKLDDACRDYFRMKELRSQNLDQDQLANIAKVANAVAIAATAAASAAAGNKNQVQDEKSSESNEVSDEEGTKSTNSTSNDSGTGTGEIENDLFEKNVPVFGNGEELFTFRKPTSRGFGHDFLMNAYLSQERNRKALENGYSGLESNNYYELFPKMPLTTVTTRPPPGFTEPRMK